MKIIAISFLAISAIALTSCKKSYLCTCVNEVRVSGTNRNESNSFILKATDRKKAQIICSMSNDQKSGIDFSSNKLCKID